MDSIIPLGQKNTLVEYMILSGAENHPPMLDKDLYGSWKSRMELYMQNREHERMILKSVEHVPLIWPTIEENRVTRTKKYAELSTVEKIQADCDMKATNIILQGLPTDIYSLVNHHRVAKDLWERVQLLMQGTSLTKQERECKLYDAFDKFTYIKGESLHNLPPEWSKFVTDVKPVKDLHTTNFDQLHAYLEQHELHANEVCLLRLAVLVFSPGDDPIAYLNMAMAFLIVVASSRFPSINNQLRTSSNPRNQATIQYGRVTVQQVQGRQGQSYSGTGYKSNATSSRGNNASGHARVVKCYNYQAGQILDEEQLAFLADLGVPDGQAVQTIIPNNAAFRTEDLDTYDSDYDDISNAQADFEQTPVVDVTDNEITSDSNIISYSQYLQETQQANVQDTNLKAQQDSMILSVIEQMLEQMINHVNNWEKANKEQNNESVTAELERYKERVKTFEQQKLALKEQVDSLEQNLSKQIKEKECLLQTFTVFKNESKEKENKYMENEIDLEKKVKELDNIIFKVGQSAQKVHILSEDFGKRFTPQQELSAEQALWFRISNSTIESSNKPVVKVELTSELPKVSLVNASLKKLKFHLAQFDSMVKKRTTPDACTEDLLNAIIEVQIVFDQIDAAVQQSSVEKQCLEIAKKELLLENDRLLQQIMSQNVLLTVINSMSLNGESVNMERKRNESCDKCFNLDAELLKSQNAHNDLLKSYSQLEKYCISLELEKSKEEKVNYDYCEIETKNVELGNSVAKLLWENEHLCTETNHVKQVFKDQFESIKKTCVRTTEHSDSLIDKLNLKCAENEDLKAQIQDKVFVITSLKNDLRKVKGKEIIDIATQIPSANTIVPGMFKLDLDPLAPRLLQNREAHIDYLKYTQEQAVILWGIELLVYVRDTCPNAIKLNAKKVVVTPKNNVKKFRVAEPLTSSSNIKQVESYTTSDSNTPVLSPTGLKCSTGYPDCSLVSRLWMFKTYDKEPLLAHELCDYQLGNFTISRVYHVEGLGHNLFSVGQFCNADLEVAFQKNTCFIRNLEGVDLLSGSRDTNLYTIFLDYMLKTSPICLLSKASKTKSWLWHRRLSHLNFGTLNKLAKDGLARGILRLKFQKDHLCSTCALGKSMKSSHQPKDKDTSQEKLYLLHMDLCDLMRVASINEKNSGPGLHSMTPATSSSGLVPNHVSQQPCIPPKRDDWDHLFYPMFDEYFNPPSIAVSPIQEAAAPRAVVLADSPLSTSIDQDA
ncbi:retrovirus-related pol polyprotein from transposon TNT 1-94 [Tanacetum coccineum]|uniref:Retrovirus-related pol polyprotein from transposon TNT 1-94 n=1 Tax=Tanacetum coccineum TaxID=301880 RepID=A0ABQ4WJR1_9ASTR